MTHISETEQALNQTAERVSHELRNTLTSTKMTLESLKDYLPILIENYKKSKAQQITNDKISDKLLAMLEDLTNTSNTEITYAGLLLSFFSENLKPDSAKKISNEYLS